jgi:hypothetical protein
VDFLIVRIKQAGENGWLHLLEVASSTCFFILMMLTPVVLHGSVYHLPLVRAIYKLIDMDFVVFFAVFIYSACW